MIEYIQFNRDTLRTRKYTAHQGCDPSTWPWQDELTFVVLFHQSWIILPPDWQKAYQQPNPEYHPICWELTTYLVQLLKPRKAISQDKNLLLAVRMKLFLCLRIDL